MKLSRYPYPVFFFNTLDSTNEKLHEMVREQNRQELTVIITTDQTAGRGQEGNRWESEKGKNITLSILLKPVFLDPQNQFYISKTVSLAIVATLEHIGLQPEIKWPNDIFADNKKIAGILIENTLLGNSLAASVAGIGINVNQEKFSAAAGNPVSVRNILGKETDIQTLTNDLLLNMLEWYETLRSGDLEKIDAAYLDKLSRIPGFFRYKDSSGIFQAEIAGIEPSGILILKDAEGKERRYAFKEVEFLD